MLPRDGQTVLARTRGYCTVAVFVDRRWLNEGNRRRIHGVVAWRPFWTPKTKILRFAPNARQ